MSYCIPRKYIDKLKNQFKALGDNQIEKIADLSLEQKIDFFKKALPEGEASLLAKEFEKAYASKKINEIKKFVRNNLDEKYRKENDAQLALIGKDFKTTKEIKEFIEKRIDTISDQKEGLALTEKETERAIKIGEEQKRTEEALVGVEKIKNGKLNKDYVKALVDYYVAVRKGDLLLSDISGKSISETINSHLKALMLAKPSSVAINIISNAQKMTFDLAVKRVASREFNGYNTDLAIDLMKALKTIDNETSIELFGKNLGVGYDLSRALSLDELSLMKISGEQMKSGRDTWFSRLVYETGLGKADYISARVAFVDSLNVYSTEIAKSQGFTGIEAKNKAREMMLDAFDLNPKTDDGKRLRELAVKDAQHATWTDKRYISENLMKIREVINSGTKKTGIKFGDLFEPFIKTPANIIQFGTDISGLGVPKSAYKFFKLIKNKDILTKAEASDLTRSAIKDLTLSIGGLGMSFLMASMIDDDDFIGAYDPNRLKYDELRNSNSNSIRVFGHWVSLDYNILAMPLIGILYAKKNGGDNMADQIIQYFVGVGTQVSTLPFFSSIPEMAQDIQRKLGEDTDRTDVLNYLMDAMINQISSRVPGIVQDITKISDENKRETQKLSDKFLSKVPFLSTFAPVKKNIFGEPIKTTTGMSDNKFYGALLQILTGERIKISIDEDVNNEILRLKDKGFAPTFTNWRFVTSKKLKELKEKVGEEDFSIIFSDEYGNPLKKEINKLIKTDKYKKMTDEEKKKEIDKLEDEYINKIYKKYKIK